MTLRRQVFLWAAQRVSGMVLGFCVVVHLVTIMYAVRDGLVAAEILARTKGSVLWASFYLTFVMAIAIHAPLGLRVMLAEWFGWGRRATGWGAASAAFVLAATGLYAIAGVYA